MLLTIPVHAKLSFFGWQGDNFCHHQSKQRNGYPQIKKDK